VGAYCTAVAAATASWSPHSHCERFEIQRAVLTVWSQGSSIQRAVPATTSIAPTSSVLF
jgi:hypothetical protein